MRIRVYLSVHAKYFSHVCLFAILWTVALQASLLMEFSRQEYWSGLPLPPWGDLPGPGMEPTFHRSPALAGGFFTWEVAGSQHGRSHPWQGHVEEPWWARRIMTRGTPWICSSIYPKTRICLSYYFVPFTNSSDINGGYPRPPFSGKSQLRDLVNKSLGHDRSVSIQTPLMAF